jgi:hypothetical protein
MGGGWIEDRRRMGRGRMNKGCVDEGGLEKWPGTGGVNESMECG